MPDAIDDLESLLVGALQTRDTECVVCVRQVIARWRRQWGGDEIYIARREQAQRQARVVQLLEQGHSAADIAQRVGLTRQQVHNIRRKTSSYVG